MWRADCAVCIIVGADRVACLRADGGNSDGAERLSLEAVHAEKGEPFGALLRVLGAVVDAAAPRLSQDGEGVRRLRVLVSDRWAPLLGVPWNSGLQREVIAQRYAREQLQACGFEVTQNDLVRCVESGYLQPLMVAAYPRALLDAFARAAQALHATLVSVQPLNAIAWCLASRQGKPPEALAVIDGQRVSLLQARRGGLGWTPGPVRGIASQGLANLHAVWRRQRLRHPSLKSVSLMALDLQRQALFELGPEGSPSSEHLVPDIAVAAARHADAALDAVVRPSAVSAGRWAAAGVVGVVAAAAVWQSAVLNNAIDEKRQLLALRQAAVASPSGKRWTEAEHRQVRAVNAAVRELNIPLSAITRAMLPPKDVAVGLISLNVVPQKGEGAGTVRLSISAEAASSIDMTRYVTFLAERRSIESSRLVAHEIVETDPAKPYRFTVEMAWGD